MPSKFRTLWNVIKETQIGRILRRAKYRKSEKELYSDERINNAMIVFGILPKREKEIKLIKDDLIATCKKYRFDADEYFLYNLYGKSEEEKATFISGRERMELCAKMNKGKNRELFDNKWETYLRFKSFFRRELCKVESVKDRDAFLSFAERNKSFVVKPLSSHGVLKFDIRDDDNLDDIFNDLMDRYANEVRPGFIAETCIIQVKEMARIHPASVNTVRITTVRLPNEVIIIHPFVRFGTCSLNVKPDSKDTIAGHRKTDKPDSL